MRTTQRSETRGRLLKSLGEFSKNGGTLEFCGKVYVKESKIFGTHKGSFTTNIQRQNTGE